MLEELTEPELIYLSVEEDMYTGRGSKTDDGKLLKKCVVTCPVAFLEEEIKNSCVCVRVTQSCLTLCHPVACSPPGTSVHGILQARILQWLAIPFSRGSSQLRDRTPAPALQVDSLPSEPPEKSPIIYD